MDQENWETVLSARVPVVLSQQMSTFCKRPDVTGNVKENTAAAVLMWTKITIKERAKWLAKWSEVAPGYRQKSMQYVAARDRQAAARLQGSLK